MREVINRLPSAVMLGSGSLSRTAVAKHRGPSKLMRELPKLRPEFPEMDLTAEAEYIPVPREVARVFNNLIDAAMYEEHRRLSDLGAFLTDDANSRHPAVQEWRNLSQFFTRWAHLSEPDIPSTGQSSSDAHVVVDTGLQAIQGSTPT